jgi:glycosyltransferase involved in cell wall biosynthesis
MRVLLIVPAYNEAANLPRLLEGLRAAVPEYDVCVVDDGSTDDTAEVAATYGVRVLRCPLNLGIGGAVQTGYLWAQRAGYDVAVQVDGDGQHLPNEVSRLLVPVLEGDADLVIGSRFLDDGGFQSTYLRRMGIHYITRLLRWRWGLPVTDPTSGFRAAGAEAIKLFSTYYATDYPEPESLALASHRGLRIAEVATPMREREHGESSIDRWRTLDYLVKVTLSLLLGWDRRALGRSTTQ